MVTDYSHYRVKSFKRVDSSLQLQPAALPAHTHPTSTNTDIHTYRYGWLNEALPLSLIKPLWNIYLFHLVHFFLLLLLLPFIYFGFVIFSSLIPLDHLDTMSRSKMDSHVCVFLFMNILIILIIIIHDMMIIIILYVLLLDLFFSFSFFLFYFFFFCFFSCLPFLFLFYRSFIFRRILSLSRDTWQIQNQE